MHWSVLLWVPSPPLAETYGLVQKMDIRYPVMYRMFVEFIVDFSCYICTFLSKNKS